MVILVYSVIVIVKQGIPVLTYMTIQMLYVCEGGKQHKGLQTQI